MNFYAVNFLQTKAGPCSQTRHTSIAMQIELFYTCQIPEIYNDMVECDTCGNWYHPKCSNFHQKANNGTVNKCFKCMIVVLYSYI